MKTAKEINAIANEAREAQDKQFKEAIARIIEEYIAEPVEASAKLGLRSTTIDNLPARFFNYHSEITAQLNALGYRVHKCNSVNYMLVIGWGE